MVYRRLFAALVAVSFFYIASPLLFPIAMGSVIAVLFFPWLQRMERKKIPTPLGSAVLTLGITFIFILPISFLIFFTVKAVLQQLQLWKAAQLPGDGAFLDTFLKSPKVEHLISWLSSYAPVDAIDLANAIHEMGTSIGGKLTELLGGMLSHLPGLTMSLIVMVVSIYFCLVDGRRFLFFVRHHSFFSPSQTERLIQTLAGVCRSVILAALISGGAQSLTEICACILTGTSNFGLIGLCVFIGSFIPLVGSAPITFGIAIQQLFEGGRQTQGLILLAVAFLVIAIDNMVRPLFLRGSVNLHPLLAFVAAFGGLQTLGFLGIFLGPILAALFVVTIEVLTETVSRTV